MKNKRNFFVAQKKILKEAGCSDYKESIKLLFSKAFGMSLDQRYNTKDHDNAMLFSAMVTRRAKGEPTSHIVQSRSFWKSDFYIDETVLDPRPESELIIDVTKHLLFDRMKVLDLGCGSGCIGLSLYKENPSISLFLSDISKKALSVTKKNALKLRAECELIHSNLFSNINERFDLIVTNLPYIAKEDFFYLQKEIMLFEPHEALYGGKCGLDVIKRFLSSVSKYLNSNGMFVIEFGKGQDAFLKHELRRFNFKKFSFHRDLSDVNRIVCAKKDT